MERETGFEPATSSLGSWHSTTELLPALISHFAHPTRLDKSYRSSTQAVTSIHSLSSADQNSGKGCLLCCEVRDSIPRHLDRSPCVLKQLQYTSRPTALFRFIRVAELLSTAPERRRPAVFNGRDVHDRRSERLLSAAVNRKTSLPNKDQFRQVSTELIFNKLHSPV